MRRRRYQRGSIYPRKRSGKNYWYAQWREHGHPRSKELGLQLIDDAGPGRGDTRRDSSADQRDGGPQGLVLT